MFKVGSDNIGKMYIGSDAVAKAYIGSDLVYQSGPPSYISNGLVFHLDGADATTSQWVDKIGGITFNMTNVTLVENGGVKFSGSASYGNYSGTLDFPSSTHTIEIVLNCTATGMRVAFMINASDKVAFGYASNGQYVVTKSGNSNGRNTWKSNVNTGIHVFSITPSLAYDNKKAMTKHNTDTWYLRTGGTFVGTRTTDNALFVGTIYQIRVYNRALTADEIKHNQSIDIEKYNIS